MHTHTLTLSFITLAVPAVAIVSSLAGSTIVSHHAENNAKWRDYSPEDTQAVLAGRHGWPPGTQEDRRHDGPGVLTVTVTTEDRARLEARLAASVAEQHAWIEEAAVTA